MGLNPSSAVGFSAGNPSQGFATGVEKFCSVYIGETSQWDISSTLKLEIFFPSSLGTCLS